MPDRALRLGNEAVSHFAGPSRVRMHPMPDRALRLTNADRPKAIQRRPISPNASNARQGIKTHRDEPGIHPLVASPNASNARQGIKTPFPWFGGGGPSPGPNASNARQGIKTRSRITARVISLVYVRMHPMPDRALRLFFAGKALRVAAEGPNASNARQGIKTHQNNSCDDDNLAPRPNASNARQGIKTPFPWFGGGGPSPGPNASNARQGIKTRSRITARVISLVYVRMHPMPDRALRLFFAGKALRVAAEGPNASNARQGIKTDGVKASAWRRI